MLSNFLNSLGAIATYIIYLKRMLLVVVYTTFPSAIYIYVPNINLFDVYSKEKHRVHSWSLRLNDNLIIYGRF